VCSQVADAPLPEAAAKTAAENPWTVHPILARGGTQRQPSIAARFSSQESPLPLFGSHVASEPFFLGGPWNGAESSQPDATQPTGKSGSASSSMHFSSMSAHLRRQQEPSLAHHGPAFPAGKHPYKEQALSAVSRAGAAPLAQETLGALRRVHNGWSPMIDSPGKSKIPSSKCKSSVIFSSVYTHSRDLLLIVCILRASSPQRCAHHVRICLSNHAFDRSHFCDTRRNTASLRATR
jgi:hypothetical protein